jgi:hypothetical protein
LVREGIRGRIGALIEVVEGGEAEATAGLAVGEAGAEEAALVVAVLAVAVLVDRLLQTGISQESRRPRGLTISTVAGDHRGSMEVVSSRAV